MEKKLMACPFCGSPPKFQEYKPRGRFYEVCCPQCGELDVGERLIEDGIFEEHFGPVGSTLRTNASRVLGRDPEVTVLRTPEDVMRLAALANDVQEESTATDTEATNAGSKERNQAG